MKFLLRGNRTLLQNVKKMHENISSCKSIEEVKNMDYSPFLRPNVELIINEDNNKVMIFVTTTARKEADTKRLQNSILAKKKQQEHINTQKNRHADRIELIKKNKTNMRLKMLKKRKIGLNK